MTNVVYKPYRTHSWFAVFAACTSIILLSVSLWAMFTHMSNDIFALAGLLVIGVVSAWLTIILYKTARMTVIFNQTGLTILNRAVKKENYATWEELRYGYLSKNYKGHKFYVISPMMLDKKDLSNYTNKGARTSCMCVNNVVVLFLDPLQDTSAVEEIIQNKTVYSSSS